MRVDATHLRQKLEFLRNVHLQYNLIAGLLVHQSNPKISLDPAALARALIEERFPVAYLGALLRLYGLRPPQSLELKNPQHRAFFDIIAEPDIDAFVARVRLLGGEVTTAAPAGSAWQKLLDERRSRADEVGRSHILVNRFDKPRSLPALSMRAVQVGTWAEQLGRREPGLVLDAGERVSWMFTVGDVIRLGVSGKIHLFAFYDVMVDGRRLYVPLLPSLGADGQPLGETCTQGPFVEIPRNPSRHNALVVDSGWDERALTVVASAQPLDPQVLQDSDLDGPILAERLDLLAVRLREAERQAHGSTALMRLSYRVNQTGLNLAA